MSSYFSSTITSCFQSRAQSIWRFFSLGLRGLCKSVGMIITVIPPLFTTTQLDLDQHPEQSSNPEHVLATLATAGKAWGGGQLPGHSFCWWEEGAYKHVPLGFETWRMSIQRQGGQEMKQCDGQFLQSILAVHSAENFWQDSRETLGTTRENGRGLVEGRRGLEEW